VVDPEINVLVDAKAGEIGLLGMTSFDTDLVADRIKSSAIKAIGQACSTATALLKAGWLNASQGPLNNYLLIVTHRDLLLGTGRDLYDSYGKRRLDAILGGDAESAPIPLHHIYILSIEEFDTLVACIAQGRTSFAKLLNFAAERDGKPETKRLLLAQHMSELCPQVEIPAHLKAESERIRVRTSQRFTGTP
jgi:hypothetical protein